MTRRKRRDDFNGITTRTVKLFRTGLQLQSSGRGDSDVFKELDHQLSRELNLRPWHPSIFEVTAFIDDEEAILSGVSPEHRAFYRHVINLRRALVGAPR